MEKIVEDVITNAIRDNINRADWGPYRSKSMLEEIFESLRTVGLKPPYMQIHKIWHKERLVYLGEAIFEATNGDDLVVIERGYGPFGFQVMPVEVVCGFNRIIFNPTESFFVADYVGCTRGSATAKYIAESIVHEEWVRYENFIHSCND